MNRLHEHRIAWRYNAWANQRMLDAAALLSEEELGRDLKSSFPSVRRTLVHVLGAEWIWLRRWKGKSPADMPPEWESLDLRGITEALRAVDAERTEWIAQLTEDDLDRTIEYRNTRGDPFARPIWQMLRHVVNHSSYHRGQVTTMLRQLGASAVSTDFVYFMDQS